MADAAGGRRVLELFCGIGGMRCALALAVPGARVVAAVDINPSAEAVYRHNFGEGEYQRRDVCTLTAKQLDRLGADWWTMSPPCQPYTRQGHGKDSADARASALGHLLDLLPAMAAPPRYVLVENVERFETSDSRAALAAALRDCGYDMEEYVLSPNQFGVPYMRDRYFLIAWRQRPARDSAASEPPSLRLLRQIPGDDSCRPPLTQATAGSAPAAGGAADVQLWQEAHARAGVCTLGEFFRAAGVAVGPAEVAALRVGDAVLRGGFRTLDVVAPHYRFSRCVTKSYGRYAQGTGSVLATAAAAAAAEAPGEPDLSAATADERSPEGMRALACRFLSPAEIAALHGFPAGFAFPPTVSVRQSYALLGNGLSVTVVAALCRRLLVVGAGVPERPASATSS